MSKPRAWPLRYATWLLLAFALVLLWHLPRSAELLFNWDSVNYALGAQHYDLKLHQPHPPGYPLWIFALRSLNQLGLSANLAQLLLAQLSVAVALLTLIDLARARGRAAAWLLGALLLSSPLVALHARLAGSYTSELMSSALVGWACWDLWQGRSRRAPLAVLAWCLAAGLRSSAAVFLLPLLAVSLWRAFPGRRFRAVFALALAGLGALLCYLPVWQSLGPLPASFLYWRHMLDTLFTGPLDASSWFRGAPADVHLGMLVRLSTWWLYGLLPLVLAVLLLRLQRRAATSHVHELSELPQTSLAFLALWAAPSIGFLCLIYAPHPGYVLAPLPPMLLLLARSLPRSGPSTRQLVAALSTIVLSAELLAIPRFGPLPVPGAAPRTVGQALALASPAQIAVSDAQLRAISEVLTARPANEALLVLDVEWNLANWRKLGWVLPERPVWWLNAARGGLAWMQARERHESAELTLAAESQAVWWLAQSEQPPAVLARAFPQAERVLHNNGVSLWRTDLADNPPSSLQHGPQRWTLKRE